MKKLNDTLTGKTKRQFRKST